MRVTRLIREYVEKTVTEKIPYGEPTKAFVEAKNQMEEERVAAERDIKAYAEMRLGNVNDRMPNEFKIYLTSSGIVYSTHYNAPLAAAAREHEREVQNKRREAIDNILLNLELGATKADLERLIAEAIGE